MKPKPFEFTLNNPLTEEQWDMISDVDFDRTDRITFHTKHGKEVEFIKVIRCKDCEYYEETDETIGTCLLTASGAHVKGYCAWAERRGEE